MFGRGRAQGVFCAASCAFASVDFCLGREVWDRLSHIIKSYQKTIRVTPFDAEGRGREHLKAVDPLPFGPRLLMDL